MTTQAQIAQLHAQFCLLVPESRCVLNMARERDWFDWRKHRPDEPFTEADLRAVVKYRRGLIAQGRQFDACLKFGYLIGRPDRFEEDLAMVRAAPKPKTDREAVLEASGRPARPEQPPKMAAPLFIAALAKLRQSLE